MAKKQQQSRDESTMMFPNLGVPCGCSLQWEGAATGGKRITIGNCWFFKWWHAGLCRCQWTPPRWLEVEGMLGGSWERDGHPWFAAFSLTHWVEVLPLMTVEYSSSLLLFLVISDQIFSIRSCKVAVLAMQWHVQVMLLCHCAVNNMSKWYYHHKFFAAGVDFNDINVGWNQQRRGRE